MFAEKETSAERIGFVLGFAFSYVLFASILFIILSLEYARTLSTYVAAAMITVMVMGVGITIQRLLK